MRKQKIKKELPPTESYEQIEFFKWVEKNVHPKVAKLIWHTPNGGFRHVATAVRLKKEGAKKGVPDVTIAKACGAYHGAYIELKRVQGSKVSAEQQEYIEALTAEGYYCKIVRGHKELIEATKNYLNLKQNAYIDI